MKPMALNGRQRTALTCSPTQSSVLPGIQQHQGAGFFPRDAGGVELLLQVRVLGAGVEEDAAGLEGEDGIGLRAGDGGVHVEREGVHRAGDGGEVGGDGDAFDAFQPGVHGDDGVAVLEEELLGLPGVAVRLVAGSEDDDAFLLHEECSGSIGVMLAAGKPSLQKLRRELRHWSATALNLLYPRVCRSCDWHLAGVDPGNPLSEWFCMVCEDQLRPIREPYCSRCGETYDGALVGEFRCENCADRELAFDFAIAGYQAQGVVRDLIHQFKYSSDISLRACLGDLLLPTLEEPRLRGEDLSQWLLVPVPLHGTRQREREFNQSEELCRRLHLRTGIPMARALVRQRSTGHQASLTRSERLENLRAAFAVPGAFHKRKGALLGKRILLVDDVFTTGATTDACARVLRREAGVEKVVVITVARG